jgi:hypothetical protein
VSETSKAGYMSLLQTTIDSYLDREINVNVEISQAGQLPQSNRAYDAIRNLPQAGFSFTPRQLLHAIGCKTASIPLSSQDECLKAAYLYIHILDMNSPFLAIKHGNDSDLLTPRSQEIGIGIMCLLVGKYFDIPWDQLGPLPARGKRFDYHGSNGVHDCIFECKGTSNRSNQSVQIKHGLEKKLAHHTRNEYFDVELIVSSFVGYNNSPPKIVLADPDKSSYRRLYDKGDARYYRLKHYCRVLQYIGLPRSAFHLNLYAHEYLESKRLLRRTIMDEKMDIGFLESINIDGDIFYGRWFNSWVPEQSKRYSKLYIRERHIYDNIDYKKYSVFQGLRKDFYESGLSLEPFANLLLDQTEIQKYNNYYQQRVSVFPDGTIMIFRPIS